LIHFYKRYAYVVYEKLLKRVILEYHTEA